MMTVNDYKDKYCANGCFDGKGCPIKDTCRVDGENEYTCDLEIEKYIWKKHKIKYDFRTEEELEED